MRRQNEQSTEVITLPTDIEDKLTHCNIRQRQGLCEHLRGPSNPCRHLPINSGYGFRHFALRKQGSFRSSPAQHHFDPKFTSLFRKELATKLRIRPKMSTAHRPQMDGHADRVIQSLETFLRCNSSTTSWADELPTAELVYNAQMSQTTKYSVSKPKGRRSSAVLHKEPEYSHRENA